MCVVILQILTACYILVVLLSTEDLMVNKTDVTPALIELRGYRGVGITFLNYT